MKKLLLDIAIIASCFIVFSVIAYMKGYVKGYNEAKESYTEFYEKLIKIETNEQKTKVL